MLRSVGEGFEELDPRIEYFVKYDRTQNFGDYLPELFCKAFLAYPRVDADMYRLVGSVIDERWIRHDLGRINGHVHGLIAFWCCGARSATPLSRDTQDHCLFFGVRGPLTRDLLSLPADTVLGDPGLLAPLFHTPRLHPDTAGKTICVSHVHDSRPPHALREQAGAELLLSPVVDASEAAMRDILDKIASAEFVLTASLHAAIIACAYGRPFAFWDNGHLDIPFKWEDFAGSVNVPAVFATDLDHGRRIYRDTLAPALRIPPLAPILDVCPFMVRPAEMMRALVHDGAITEAAGNAAIPALQALGSVAPEEIRLLQRRSAGTRRGRRQVMPQAIGAIGLALRRVKRRARRLVGLT